MIRILVADDHALIREGLRKILVQTPDMTVQGETEKAEDVEKLLERSEFDVVVLDISFPGKSGLDVLRDLRKNHPQLPILMLSAHSENQFATQSLRAGASGYVNKDSPPSELIQAIRRVAQGRKYISSELAEKIAETPDTGATTDAHEKLSSREFQVFLQIANGQSARQIAEKLGLSINTINTYRARILQKMSLKNDAEVILYAFRNHLVK
jgi:two-component system, NarL family, invasion response regulator UvrY